MNSQDKYKLDNYTKPEKYSGVYTTNGTVSSMIYKPDKHLDQTVSVQDDTKIKVGDTIYTGKEIRLSLKYLSEKIREEYPEEFIWKLELV